MMSFITRILKYLNKKPKVKIKDALDKNKDMEILVCFPKGINRNQLIDYLIVSLPVDTNITHMEISGYTDTIKYLYSELEGYMYDANENCSFSFFNEKRTMEINFFRIFDKQKGYYALHIRLKNEFNGHNEFYTDWLKKLYLIIPFTVAYQYHALFKSFQSDITTNTMYVNDIDLAEYKNNLFFKAGMDYIDVSKNPGRIDFIGHIKLMAAWRMYFTKGYTKLFGEIKIPNDSSIIVEESNCFKFIQLYDNPYKSHLQENLIKLKGFRDLNNLDKIVEEHKNWSPRT